MISCTIKPGTYGELWGGATDGIGQEHAFYALAVATKFH
jgi:hypothetical protein